MNLIQQCITNCDKMVVHVRAEQRYDLVPPVAAQAANAVEDAESILAGCRPMRGGAAGQACA